MTTFQKRVALTLLQEFGENVFTPFEAASVLDTTIGNIRQTLASLVKNETLIDTPDGFYRVK